MIALLDNVQILVISKKLVNKLHSVGFITLLWLGVTQWIINEIIVTSLLVVIILCNIRFVTVTYYLGNALHLYTKVSMHLCND